MIAKMYHEARGDSSIFTRERAMHYTFSSAWEVYIASVRAEESVKNMTWGGDSLRVRGFRFVNRDQRGDP